MMMMMVPVAWILRESLESSIKGWWGEEDQQISVLSSMYTKSLCLSVSVEFGRQLHDGHRSTWNFVFASLLLGSLVSVVSLIPDE